VTVTALAFLGFLLAFVAIGVSSSRRAQPTTEDYLVAGRDVPAWLSALSSVATNNSGFMFVGLVGWAYAVGASALWMALAWVLGDAVAWAVVYRQLREETGALRSTSVPAWLGAREGGEDRVVVVATALGTLLFLGGYAAAQLQAGSVALDALFGWGPHVGALLGGVVVVAYCLSGGLRASIWTDGAQAVVMLGAMVALLVGGLARVGGLSGLQAALAAQDPSLVSPWPPEAALGALAWFGGYVAGGFGAVGQPHILVRMMALRSPDDVPRAATVYFAWFVPFYGAAVLCALLARAVVPELDATGAQAALPALGAAVLPDVLQGLLLAGLFSATLSTADSQLLSCSAAVTQDLVPAWRGRPWAAKAATLTVGALVLGLALTASGGVFALVLGAWGYLAVSVGPLVLLRTLGRPLHGLGAVGVMAAGVTALTAWQAAGLGGAVYGVLPGLGAALLAAGAARALSG
jgi:sodium/proline symporter